jgi:dipeptidyl aminopeptidase/acylaminoacyl peptidase
MKALFLLAVLPALVSAQETVQPNENLVTDGLPAIPSMIAEKARKYTEYRQAVLQSWHPTRREILILTRFADTNQVHLVTMPAGDRKQLTFYPDRITGAAFPNDGGDYFVFSKDTGGNEFYQNYRFDLATGEVGLLTDGKSRHSLGVWSKSGTLQAYTSTRRNGKDSDIYVMDDAQKSTDRLVAEVDGGGWSPVDWSGDNSKLLVLEYISVNDTNLYLIDVRSGEKSLLTPKPAGAKIAYGPAKFSADGKGFYTTSDDGSEFQQLGYFDLATKRFTPITTDIPWNVETFDLSRDGKSLVFVTNEDGISQVYLLDTETNRTTPLGGVPSGVISNVGFDSTGREIALNVSSYDAPTDVFSYHLDSARVERWTESETGGIAPGNFAAPQLIKWPSFDGRTISGFLYRPKMGGASSAPSRAKVPVIVSIHGGPEAQYRPGFVGRFDYFLNELGVAIIFPNVRGSDGYGKTFLQLDNGMKREDSVKDIGALLDWIKQQPDLDGDRIMITGGSYGGYMTLAASTHFSDKIRCSLSVVGISNFVSFLERTESYRRDLRRVEYGDERDPQMREFLTRISPLTSADRIQKPLFIVQGKNDPRVPLNEAEQIVRQLKQNQRTVWYLLANDEGHGFAKKKNADFQFYAMVKFVEDVLLK